MDSELIRHCMRENGFNQTFVCDGCLVGFRRAKLNGEYVSIELAVDFKRRKVAVTKIREDELLNSRNRFREADYEEEEWQTQDDVLHLIKKFSKVLRG